MMVSTKGRYALRVMIDLAEQNSDKFVPLKTIAQRQGISEKYLESILKLLVKEKMLTGLRGKGGGYRLNYLPEQYTVGAILRLTEESLAPVTCLNQDVEQCSRMSQCKTITMWRKLDKLIQDYLDSVTLADLVSSGTDWDNYEI